MVGRAWAAAQRKQRKRSLTPQEQDPPDCRQPRHTHAGQRAMAALRQRELWKANEGEERAKTGQERSQEGGYLQTEVRPRMRSVWTRAAHQKLRLESQTTLSHAISK